MAAPRAEHGGLQVLVRSCQRSFRKLRDSLSQQGSAAIVEEQHQRYDLWCRNIGAHRTGHASLEYRFRDAPKVYDYAQRLLADLSESLLLAIAELQGASGHGTEGEESGGSEDDDDDDDEDEFLKSFNAKPALDVLLESVVGLIDRLYRLSFKVRNPAMRINLEKISTFREVDPDTGVDIFSTYSTLDHRHVRELLDDLRNLGGQNDAQEDVVGKVSPQTAPPSADGSQKQGADPADHMRLSDDATLNSYLSTRLAGANTLRRRQFRYWSAHQRKLARLEPGSVTAGTKQEPVMLHQDVPIVTPSLASTEATKVREEQVELNDTRSVLSSATYAMMQTEGDQEELGLPPFPRWLRDKKEFECPYCLVMCPGSMARKSAWETHILRDLRPYVCTIQDCRQEGQLFDTFQSWRLHETHDHDVHPTELTRDCPLCLQKKISWTHVASHLQRIALFALPRFQTGGVDENAELNSQEAMRSQVSRQGSSVSSDATGDSQQSRPGRRIAALGIVIGVTPEVRVAELMESLEQFGRLEDFEISTARETAFFEFDRMDALTTAIANSPLRVSGQKVTIQSTTARPGSGDLRKLLSSTPENGLLDGKRSLMTGFLESVRVEEPIAVSQNEAASSSRPEPKSAMDLILDLQDRLRNHWRPICRAFIELRTEMNRASEKEYRRLNESILQEIILKADSIETDGRNEVRKARRELVAEANDLLKLLDSARYVRRNKPTKLSKERPQVGSDSRIDEATTAQSFEKSRSELVQDMIEQAFRDDSTRVGDLRRQLANRFGVKYNTVRVQCNGMDLEADNHLLAHSGRNPDNTIAFIDNRKLTDSYDEEAVNAPDRIYVNFDGTEFELYFPPYSLAEKKATVQQLCTEIEQRFSLRPRSIGITYKGGRLLDVSRPLCYYGVKQNSNVNAIDYSASEDRIEPLDSQKSGVSVTPGQQATDPSEAVEPAEGTSGIIPNKFGRSLLPPGSYT